MIVVALVAVTVIAFVLMAALRPPVQPHNRGCDCRECEPFYRHEFEKEMRWTK